MRFVKKAVSLKTAGLLLAGAALLAVPAIAQQEVAPDHFDEKPSVSRPHKPAPQARKTTDAKTTRSAVSQAAPAPKSKAATRAPSVLKADAAGQAGSNPR
jgi:hypothetical protein